MSLESAELRTIFDAKGYGGAFPPRFSCAPRMSEKLRPLRELAATPVSSAASPYMFSARPRRRSILILKRSLLRASRRAAASGAP